VNDPQSQPLNPIERAVVERAVAHCLHEVNEPLTSDERSAMRAFLQRAETRLSTYQRIAGVFLNGAGLLILLPATARDSVQSVVAFSLNGGFSLNLTLLFGWLVALVLPLYAFVLLLRDLVEFYFAPRFLSNDNIQLTRFSLAGLSFSYDESIEAKARILAYGVTHPAYVRFVLGDSGAPARKSAREIYDDSKGGNIAFPIRRDLSRRLSIEQGESGNEPTDAEYAMVAASIAGSLDITLTEEVTRIEASLERHVLGLRRLVLRYMKALILFVWTTILTLLIVGVLGAGSISTDQKLIFGLLTYLVWSVTAIFLVRLPRFWIDRLARTDKRDPDAPHRVAQDQDIKKFETRVTWALALSALVLAVLLTIAIVRLL
jgi:hypothetical protein